MHQLRRILVGLDRAVFAAERGVLLFSVVMMIALVFADVVQRTFSRPVGKTAQLILWVLGDVAQETEARVGETIGPLVFWALTVVIMVAATQSARNFALKRREGESRNAPFPPSIPVGVALTLAIFGVIRLLLWAAPSGIPGAQKMALGFLVWSGFIGASLAVRARRHIFLDAVKKKLTPDVAPWFSAAGALLTSSFCFFLAYMGGKKAATEIAEWSASGGVIHMYESVPIPTWTVTLAIPVTLAVLSARFLFAGLGELVFGAPLRAGADEHGIDFEALQGQSDARLDSVADAASGFLIGRPHAEFRSPGQGSAR